MFKPFYLFQQHEEVVAQWGANDQRQLLISRKGLQQLFPIYESAKILPS